MTRLDRKLIPYIDWPLISVVFLIPLFGLIVLYSAGYDPDLTEPYIRWLPIAVHSHAFAKQIVFILSGILVLIIAAFIPPQYLLKAAYPFYWTCVVLLLLVAEFGVVVKGSQRWLDLGPFNLQPAEPVKLGVILALARYLSKNPPSSGGYSFKSLIFPCCIFLIPMSLILKQPDLGSALTVGANGFLMVLFMGIRPRVLITFLVLGLVLVYPSWKWGLRDYQKRRIEVLLNPEADPKGSGWHITQSKIAVGSGQLFGEGFMNGTQTQLEFLPEHTTDFIFSVLAEEWGFFGCLIVLSLYLFFLYRMLRIVVKQRDLFCALVAFGVAAKFFVHMMVNIGMVIGLLPVVGIPLPLFSYGGSSILSSLFGIGLVVGVSIRRRALHLR